MKSRSGNVGNLMMSILLLLIGSLLIYGNTLDRAVGDAIAKVLEKPVSSALLGIVLVLSVVLRWVGGIGKRKKNFVEFESTDGLIGISSGAIQDFVQRIGREFDAVRSVDSRLVQEKGGLDIELNLTILAGHPIPELSRQLQARIRSSVSESLGLEGIRNIRIRVKEISGQPKKPAKPEDAVEEEIGKHASS